MVFHTYILLSLFELLTYIYLNKKSVMSKIKAPDELIQCVSLSICVPTVKLYIIHIIIQPILTFITYLLEQQKCYV